MLRQRIQRGPVVGPADRPPYPKDGINDYIVDGAASVNPERVGTKAALHYLLEVPAGGTKEIRLRLSHVADPAEEWSPVRREAARRARPGRRLRVA